jgi:hypothetical protein
VGGRRTVTVVDEDAVHPTPVSVLMVIGFVQVLDEAT